MGKTREALWKEKEWQTQVPEEAERCVPGSRARPQGSPGKWTVLRKATEGGDVCPTFSLSPWSPPLSSVPWDLLCPLPSGCCEHSDPKVHKILLYSVKPLNETITMVVIITTALGWGGRMHNPVSPPSRSQSRGYSNTESGN